jgi:hypothetical protein
MITGPTPPDGCSVLCPPHAALDSGLVASSFLAFFKRLVLVIGFLVGMDFSSCVRLPRPGRITPCMQIARHCQQARAARGKFLRFCARPRPAALPPFQNRWKNQCPLIISTRPSATVWPLHRNGPPPHSTTIVVTKTCPVPAVTQARRIRWQITAFRSACLPGQAGVPPTHLTLSPAQPARI